MRKGESKTDPKLKVNLDLECNLRQKKSVEVGLMKKKNA